ncbi:fumarylacetoacetate hydrolase family protein [Ferrimonas pelagia]|uniref:Fumarylacetoacetate hydrolase family protein n=1 Tax=Ferrimonas pelagia TaxID=1177826 RepID=A0ABP9EAY8_9GAMM
MRVVKEGQEQVTPSKILCVGRNYLAHIEELANAVPEQMVVFCKPNSAIGERLVAQRGDEPVHYEAELCFLYRQGRFVSVAVGLDLTLRESQQRLKQQGLPWERCKAFDGSALFSAFVPMPKASAGLALELRIDGAIVQAAPIELMIYSPAAILAEIQSFMTLEDGDLVMTGTPAGVGVVPAGSRFEAQVLHRAQPLVGASWHAQ